MLLAGQFVAGTPVFCCNWLEELKQMLRGAFVTEGCCPEIRSGHLSSGSLESAIQPSIWACPTNPHANMRAHFGQQSYVVAHYEDGYIGEL